MPHAHAIIDTPAALGVLDEEEGCLRTVSPRGKQATEWIGLGIGRTPQERVRATGHAIWLPRPLHHATQLEDRIATRTQDIKTPCEALSWLAPNSLGERTQAETTPTAPSQRTSACVRNQSPGFDAGAQAHRALWPGPGIATAKREVHLDTAALLEKEEQGGRPRAARRLLR